MNTNKGDDQNQFIDVSDYINNVEDYIKKTEDYSSKDEYDYYDSNLMSCPDCGRDVSIYAYSCPHCGRPLRRRRRRRVYVEESSTGATVAKVIIGIIIAIIGFYLLASGAFNIGRGR